jgi:hypothetical protein
MQLNKVSAPGNHKIDRYVKVVKLKQLLNYARYTLSKL